MKQLVPALFGVGAVMALTGAAVFITGWIYAPYIYTIGAGFIALAQVNTPVKGKSKTLKRLRVQQIFGALALILTGAFMFTTRGNEWIACLTIAAILELYTAFRIPQEEENRLKFIDFSEKLMPLKHSFFCWFHNENDKEAVRKYLLKYIYTYPLRAACSVVVQHHGARFIEEYIISQLLLQWVRNDEDFDGIRYESCSDSDEVKSYGGHNIVLMTKQFDTDGYDVKLRECIKIGVPEKFDINELKCDERLVDLLNGNELSSAPFLWGMESISDDYQPI